MCTRATLSVQVQRLSTELEEVRAAERAKLGALQRSTESLEAFLTGRAARDERAAADALRRSVLLAWRLQTMRPARACLGVTFGVLCIMTRFA